MSFFRRMLKKEKVEKKDHEALILTPLVRRSSLNGLKVPKEIEVVKERRSLPLREEDLERKIEGVVVAGYKIGPVTYILYNRGGLTRLRIEEPKVDNNELKEVIAGLRSPKNIEEKYFVERLRSGYGVLYPLIIDPHIEEIVVEKPNTYVVVIHKLVSDRWIEVDMKLNEEELDSLALQLARLAGKTISLASPFAEGLTREGHRIAVTYLREISRFGSSVVIRKFPSKEITITDMVAERILSPLMAAYLWLLIEAQRFIIVIGSMGAGKTTLLQALASLIPPYRRVVTIEDTPEIKLPVRHWDSLITRPSLPGSEVNEIYLETLLKFALRKRAEYIIVGEVRGREAKLLAQAAASGHGTLTTFHADSPEAAIVRLSTEPISLPKAFLKTIATFVHIKRYPNYAGGMRRRIAGITEVVDEELVDVFKLDVRIDEHIPKSPQEFLKISGRIHEAWEVLGYPHSDLEAELEERVNFIKKSLGDDPDIFYKKLAEFYARRYGLPGP